MKSKKLYTRLLALMLVLILGLCAVACGKAEEPEAPAEEPAPEATEEPVVITEPVIATMEVEDFGTIVMEKRLPLPLR